MSFREFVSRLSPKERSGLYDALIEVMDSDGYEGEEDY